MAIQTMKAQVGSKLARENSNKFIPDQIVFWLWLEIEIFTSEPTFSNMMELVCRLTKRVHIGSELNNLKMIKSFLSRSV